MLMQNFQAQLVRPPIAIGRTTASGVEEWALGFGCHAVFVDVMKNRFFCKTLDPRLLARICGD
jgi:hypothetical protein